MHHFSLRERLGLGAAAGIFLTLGVGCYAHTQSSRASVPPVASRAVASRAALAPMSVSSASTLAPSTSLDIAAGGSGLETPAKDAAAIAAITPTPAASSVVVVHVAGAVKKPGVYKLKPGDRLCDAVAAAGGFKTTAQQDALNLADTVQDADQVYVPIQEKPGAQTRPAAVVSGTPVAQAVSSPTATAAPPTMSKSVAKRGRVLGKKAVPVVTEPVLVDPGEGEEAAPVAGGVAKTSGMSKSARKTGGSKASGKFKNPGDGTVNINTATGAQLQKLPGVGPAMSARILQYRTEIGRFASPEQLMDVKCPLSV